MRHPLLRALVGALIGVVAMAAAWVGVAMVDAPIPVSPRAFGEAPKSTGAVRLSFVETGRSSPAGWRLAQGMGLSAHPIVYRAALIEHPRGRIVFNTGIGPGRTPQALEGGVATPFGSAELGTPLATAIETWKPDGVLLSTLRWYNIGGLDAVPSVPVWTTSGERWFALNGPWPGRMAIDRAWIVPFAERLRTRRMDGPRVLGSRGSSDLFGDGSVLLLSWRGASAEELSLLVTLGDGRRLLLTSDTLWVRDQLEHARMRYMGASFLHDRNRMQLWANLQTLIALHRQVGSGPGAITIVPMLDGTVEVPRWPTWW